MAGTDIITRENVVYAEVGGRELHLNLAWPAEPPILPMPAVMWIHGGGWCGGDHLAGEHLALAREGYFGANVEYRLSQEAIFPAQIHDCKAALRFLRAHAAEYRLDPNRIGVWGASAGGHLAALLGVSGDVGELEGDLGYPEQSSAVQAVVDIFGPSDLTRLVQRQAEYVVVAEVVDQLFGGPLAERLPLARAASPLCHVSADSAPFLILHGDSDEVVPLNQSEQLHAALQAAGVESALVVVKHAGHGFTPESDPPQEELHRLCVEFFDRHLKA